MLVLSGKSHKARNFVVDSETATLNIIVVGKEVVLCSIITSSVIIGRINYLHELTDFHAPRCCVAIILFVSSKKHIIFIILRRPTSCLLVLMIRFLSSVEDAVTTGTTDHDLKKVEMILHLRSVPSIPPILLVT